MEQEDLNSLRKSIRTGDVFALAYFIVFLILYVVGIATINHIIGVIIGYISVKFVYELQYKKYQKEEVHIGTSVLFNVLVYGIAMFVMVLVSDVTLFTGALLLIVYRQILMYKFKKLVS